MSDGETIAIVAGLTLVELAGDAALKIAADLAGEKKSNALSFIAGIVAYAALGGIIYTSDREGMMWGISNSYWNAVNNIVTPAVFMIFFGEKYSAMQWVGFGVISAGILLVGMGS